MIPSEANLPLRAATYARQSKARADESAASPQAQREAATSFAAARGWQHVGHYEDVGASGYDPKAERPGLDALLATVRRREVDVVIVYRLDRLTRRGVVEAVRLVGEFAEHDAALSSVMEPYLDTSTPMNRGIFGLFAAMAEQESTNIEQRTRAAKAVLRRAGSYAGGPRVFGYSLGKEYRDGLTITVLVPVPKEAEVIADVARRVLEGASIAGEAKRLNRERIRTSTGKKWATASLSRLLKSPTIAGYLVERRPTMIDSLDEDGKPRKIQRGYERVVIRDESGRPVTAWPAVVDPTDWHRLQEVIGTRSSGRGPRPNPTLLGGADFFRCGDCGGRMGGDRRGEGRGSYRCIRHRSGSDDCKGAAISMPHLDAYLSRLVWDRAVDLDPDDADDLATLRSIAIRFNDATESDPEADSARRAALAVIADAETALNQLDDDRAAGVFAGPFGTERYRRQASALDDRAEAARATLATIPEPTSGDDLSGLLELLTVLRDADVIDSSESPWQTWTMEERRAFLSLFLGDVTLTKAAGRGGGDKVAWRGAERLTVKWVGEVVPF
ncbi:recombinase family protein [Pedococcus sp. KACC 23699]|uniref:Recombinase family protein n=1 Tax=Pedococcus sp. KACC 23699 TaxID=3149228 RepID=A0AAU7JUQ2_9MICO